MSRVVVMLSLSLDGFFEGPTGDISWHHVTEDLHRDMNAVLGASGGLLNGRRNWELGSVGHGATLHRSLDVVPALKEQAEGDLYAGGGTLAAELARRGWVDRYVLHINPIVLGTGTPLFVQGERRELRLVTHKTYDDGVVQLHYDVAR